MQIGILTYDYIRIKTQDTFLIAILILVLIVLISVAVSIIDYYRRKIMIDKPVNIILNATEKISKGEFDNPIDIGRNYSDYNKYDLIMDNLNQMAKNLKSFEVLKSDFISNVSHEIKTPLSVIQNYAYCLKNCKLDRETSEKYLDTLILSTKRLSDLITNILKLNKLENQPAETEKEQFYLTRTIENAI
jgi:signal transduction histidine kinase